jgi:hypothetical protein
MALVTAVKTPTDSTALTPNPAALDANNALPRLVPMPKVDTDDLGVIINCSTDDSCGYDHRRSSGAAAALDAHHVGKTRTSINARLKRAKIMAGHPLKIEEVARFEKKCRAKDPDCHIWYDTAAGGRPIVTHSRCGHFPVKMKGLFQPGYFFRHVDNCEGRV